MLSIIWVISANRRGAQKAMEASMKETSLRGDGRMVEAKTPEGKGFQDETQGARCRVWKG